MQQLHKLFGNSATTPLTAAAANAVAANAVAANAAAANAANAAAAIANTMWLLHGALRIVQLPHQCVSSVSDGN